MDDLSRYLGRVDAEQFRAEQVAMRAEVIRTELAKTLGEFAPGDLLVDALGSDAERHADLLAAFRAGPDAFHKLAAELVEAELTARADYLAEKSQQAYETAVERGVSL
jgi:hypothetical protein